MNTDCQKSEEDGCTCGNLVYNLDIVGSSGHMMNCPVYRIMQLEHNLEILMDTMMRVLPDDPKRLETVEAYAEEFLEAADSWEKAVKLAQEKLNLAEKKISFQGQQIYHLRRAIYDATVNAVIPIKTTEALKAATWWEPK
jgi:predicted GTPase